MPPFDYHRPDTVDEAVAHPGHLIDIGRVQGLQSIEVNNDGTCLGRCERDNYRGVGEGGMIGAPAAITNAVEDALADLGVRITEQHLPPTRILELGRRHPRTTACDSRSALS